MSNRVHDCFPHLLHGGLLVGVMLDVLTIFHSNADSKIIVNASTPQNLNTQDMPS